METGTSAETPRWGWSKSHIPQVTASEELLTTGGTQVAFPWLPGLELGWVERLSQGGRTWSGESPSVHIRPPPPCLLSVLAGWALLAAAPTPPRLTSLCVLPELTVTPLSTTCLHCPFSHSVSFAPSTPPPTLCHPFILSLCLWLSLASAPSLPPYHSLHLRPELPSLSGNPGSPCLCWGLPLPLSLLLLFTLIFSYPSPCCLLARPISVSPLLSGSQTLGSPEGPSRSDVH